MTKMDSQTATGVQLLEVSAGLEGQRIDNFLLARLKGVPKTMIYRILRKGEVRVNKGRITVLKKAISYECRQCV